MQSLIKRTASIVTRVNFQAPQVVRAMGSGPFDDKERAQEKMYIDKEESTPIFFLFHVVKPFCIGKIMQKLLDKLNKQSHLDRHEVESSRSDTTQQLQVSIKPYLSCHLF